MGMKDIENRSWGTNFRGRIYVHAPKRFDDTALKWLWDKGVPVTKALLSLPSVTPRGFIIGEVDIVNCVTESKSVWFVGKFGFILANPVLYSKPIACKGKRGFFNPEVEKVVYALPEV